MARPAPPPSAPSSITISLPPIQVPAIHVHDPAPALITKRNSAHVGMSGPELVRTLRAMRADPRFREAVIAHGKSYRAAAPEAIVAYLRATPAALATDGAEDGDDVLRELGYDKAGTR